MICEFTIKDGELPRKFLVKGQDIHCIRTKSDADNAKPECRCILHYKSGFVEITETIEESKKIWESGL